MQILNLPRKLRLEFDGEKTRHRRSCARQAVLYQSPFLITRLAIVLKQHLPEHSESHPLFIAPCYSTLTSDPTDNDLVTQQLVNHLIEPHDR